MPARRHLPPPIAQVWRRGVCTIFVVALATPLVSLGLSHAAGSDQTTVPSSTTTTTSSTTAVGTSGYGVGLMRCTFVDSSRIVPNYATEHPTVLDRRRVLVTEIRYPTLVATSTSNESVGAAPAPMDGGFATIVFAPGYDVVPDDYRALLDAWVRRGFVVAAPIFPDTNPTSVAAQPRTDTERDLHNQPADLTFITRQLLADSSTLHRACPHVFGLVRSSALALAGQSDGGDTVGQLAYSTGSDPQKVPYRLLRAGLSFRAAIVMSGGELGEAKYRALATSPPLMVIQSARDRCNAPAGALQFYRDIKTNDKWFLELMTAHHFPPYNGTDRSAFTSVANVTTQFLEWNLMGTTSPSDVTHAGSAHPTVAKIFHNGVGPTIAPLHLPALCGTT